MAWGSNITSLDRWKLPETRDERQYNRERALKENKEAIYKRLSDAMNAVEGNDALEKELTDLETTINSVNLNDTATSDAVEKELDSIEAEIELEEGALDLPLFNNKSDNMQNQLNNNIKPDDSQSLFGNNNISYV